MRYVSTNRETTREGQVCENNSVGRIVGLERTDERGFDELRVEVGV